MMKKGILLFAIVSALITSSCKKEYSCVCTNVPYIGTRITDLGKQTKSNAEAACKKIYKGTPSNQSISCEIK